MNYDQPMRYTVVESADRAGALIATDGCGEESLAANIPNLQRIDGGTDGSHRLGREIARRWNAHPDLLAACEAAAAGTRWNLDGPQDRHGWVISPAAVEAVLSAIAKARGV